MTDWQTIFAAALLLAIVLGKPSLTLGAVMLANLAGTMVLHGNPLAVGVLDLVCAAILIGRGNREIAVAALFVLMVPVYIAGKANGWSPATTYAIVEAIAYIQVGVMGNVGGGMARGIGAVRRWGAVSIGSGPGREVRPVARHLARGVEDAGGGR